MLNIANERVRELTQVDADCVFRVTKEESTLLECQNHYAIQQAMYETSKRHVEEALHAVETARNNS